MSAIVVVRPVSEYICMVKVGGVVSLLLHVLITNALFVLIDHVVHGIGRVRIAGVPSFVALIVPPLRANEVVLT